MFAPTKILRLCLKNLQKLKHGRSSLTEQNYHIHKILLCDYGCLLSPPKRLNRFGWLIAQNFSNFLRFLNPEAHWPLTPGTLTPGHIWVKEWNLFFYFGFKVIFMVLLTPNYSYKLHWPNLWPLSKVKGSKYDPKILFHIRIPLGFGL